MASIFNSSLSIMNTNLRVIPRSFINWRFFFALQKLLDVSSFKIIINILHDRIFVNFKILKTLQIQILQWRLMLQLFWGFGRAKIIFLGWLLKSTLALTQWIDLNFDCLWFYLRLLQWLDFFYFLVLFVGYFRLKWFEIKFFVLR